MTLRRSTSAIYLPAFLLLGLFGVVFANPPASVPRIALIIDDLGNNYQPGMRAVSLPAPVACAVMPHTRYGAQLARAANATNKEVLLHLPMQPMQMNRIAGPGEISLDNGREELGRIFAEDMNSAPHVVGVNNHMGSLITRHPGHMSWLMEEIGERGNLFFVDSYTTPQSVALLLALEQGIPAARRDVFLDNDPRSENIAAQFAELKRRAREDGYAIGIGHPYDTTLDFLEIALPLLAEEGIQVVPVSDLLTAPTRLKQAITHAR